MKFRLEKDFLGEKEIPAEAYWGIHTQRALENFPISGHKVHLSLIKALALVKKACCQANVELGCLGSREGGAVSQACDEILGGKWADQFPVDALQGGAGTSTHMNLNEVLANRAIEILGGSRGDYGLIHPIETVNLHQSTNDVYPTAIKVAAVFLLRDLSQAIAKVQGAFQKKEREFARIVKIGRTELQEAVPITLGAEFSAFGEAFARDRWRTFKCEERLRVVNLGGTAVGTGLTSPRSFIFRAVEKLRELTGIGLSRGENLLDATANSDPFVEVSGILKAHASNLIKIGNDLRLLHFPGRNRAAETAARFFDHARQGKSRPPGSGDASRPQGHGQRLSDCGSLLPRHVSDQRIPAPAGPCPSGIAGYPDPPQPDPCGSCRGNLRER